MGPRKEDQGLAEIGIKEEQRKKKTREEKKIMRLIFTDLQNKIS